LSERSGADATWRALERGARDRLAEAGIDDSAESARRIVDEVAGRAGADAVLRDDERPNALQRRVFAERIERRCTGEPLQYVLGRWGFRTLDLLVDRRVLIPRPETEVVAGHAIDALDAFRRDAIAVDLGTGSGAIALAIAAERWPHVEVWATDSSPDALAVARANLAGLGRRASAVHLVEGDWYGALPDDLRGRVDVIVSNPPYIAADDELPRAVRDWEPASALLAGHSGLEAIERIVVDAPRWLVPGGALVVEIGEEQGAAAQAIADAAGLAGIQIHPDLTGRDRVLTATRVGEVGA
jgi:release factor glutamine methyltransferase